LHIRIVGFDEKEFDLSEIFILSHLRVRADVLAGGICVLGTGASVHARRIADEMLPRAESMARLAERLQSGQVVMIPL
jgi:hypothetical protein